LDDGAEHGRTTRSRAQFPPQPGVPPSAPSCHARRIGPPGVSNWSAGPPTLLRLRLLGCRSCLSYYCRQVFFHTCSLRCSLRSTRQLTSALARAHPDIPHG
ncbi:unnamed protein product, partial [Ectocarpus fasciculatus]